MSLRILVTRPAHQAGELERLLTDRGLSPVAIPAVSILPGSAADLDAMLARLPGASWLVMTSANGAEALGDRLEASSASLPDGLRVAAVGPATAEALARRGIAVDHVPDVYRTTAIADGLGDVRGKRVVLARADVATPDLPDALRRRGATVEEVTAYRVVEAPAGSRDALRAALRGGLRGVAFTSSSTVRGVLGLASHLDRGRLRTLPAFCIGPPTAETARLHGFDVALAAPVHTAAGLADLIASHFARKEP